MKARVKRFVGVVCLLAGSVVLCSMLAQAPVPAAEQAELTRTVSELDTKLFDAYNHCDLKTLGAMVSDDLEFYHDQTGLIGGQGSVPRGDSEQHLREGGADTGAGVAGGVQAEGVWGGGDRGASVP